MTAKYNSLRWKIAGYLSRLSDKFYNDRAMHGVKSNELLRPGAIEVGDILLVPSVVVGLSKDNTHVEFLLENSKTPLVCKYTYQREDLVNRLEARNPY